MGWLTGINFKRKDNDVIELTATFERINFSESNSDLFYRVRELVADHLAREIKNKYIEDLVSKVSIEDIREKALEAFRDDIKKKFKSER
jgi:hypothetical protein